MQEYLSLARELAHDAGSTMKQYFKVGVESELKSDNTPVTEADKKINDMVISKISAKFPGHSIIGEEASSLKGSSNYSWVCDPIDGTIPFTYGVPTNMFSLALVKAGEPILGVLYDPYMDRLYEAVKGRGSTLNGKKLQVSKDSTLSGKRIGLSGPPTKMVDMAGFHAATVNKHIRNIYLASTVYESSLVASGQISACVFPGVTAHDLAAVKIVVEEAGGLVTDLNGQQQRYDQTINGGIVSNGLVHQELLELLRPYLISP